MSDDNDGEKPGSDQKNKRKKSSFRPGPESVVIDIDEVKAKAKAEKDKRDQERAGAGDLIITTVEEINEDYAIAQFGGRVTAIRTTDKECQFLSLDSLGAWLRNRFILLNSGLEGAFKIWMSAPNRRSYDKVVFLPGQNVPENHLNLWNGWGVEPRPCEWPTIRHHLREIVCKGHEDRYQYLMSWFAHMIQKTLEKPEVAIVIKGLKGTGKDLVAQLAGRLIGMRHYVHIDRPDGITNKFNAQFEKGILVHFEEAFFSGDKAKKGVLQALITSPTIPMERKGFDVVEMPSYARVIMTTNEQKAIPATEDERRYFVLDISEEKKGDFSYFSRLSKAINGEEAQGFMHFLLGRDISRWEARDVQRTAGLLEQKLASLENVDAWWFEMLSMAEFPDVNFVEVSSNYGDRYFEQRSVIEWDDSGETRVRKDCIRDSYYDFLRRRRYSGEPVSDVEFGKFMGKNGADGGLKAPSGIYKDAAGEPWRPKIYLLKTLAEARKMFTERMGGGEIEWPKKPADDK